MFILTLDRRVANEGKSLLRSSSKRPPFS